jgi:hypothetical protein
MAGSEQELNRAEELLKKQEAINKAKEKQRELDADILGLSSSLVDSIKEIQGISTKRSTFDQNVLKINKGINKEILGQKSGLSDISTIQKQISKNNDLIEKSELTFNGLVSDREKFRVKAATNRANDVSKEQSIQNEILEKLSRGEEVRKGSLESSQKRQAEAERLLRFHTDLLSPMGKQAVFTKQQSLELERQNKLRAKEIQNLEKVQNSLGLSGILAKGLSKIPGIGDKASKAFKSVEDKVKSTVKETGKAPSKLKTMSMLAGEFGKELLDAVNDPLAIISAIGTAMLKNNSKITEFERSMAMSAGDAKKFAGEFSDISKTSSDINVNTANLVHNFQDMSEALGFMATFSDKTLETATKLQYTLGVSADSAANLAGAAEVAGGDFENQYKNALLASHEVQREYGTRVDLRKVMEQTGKISGILRANLGANIENIAEAVTKASLFGSTLENVANAGSALLDFESSITKELEAEMLIGRDLNLERARAAALAGDQVTLMEELNSQMGSLEDFQDMNVLQQQALAGAMGMTGDQLADILMKQEIQGRTAEQLKAAGKDDLAAMVEKQSAQESFNAAVAQLKGLFTDTMKFLDPILQGFSSMVKGAMRFKEEFGGIIKYGLILGGIYKTIMAAESALVALNIKKAFMGTRILGLMGLQNAAVGYQLAREEKNNVLKSIGVALEQTTLGKLYTKISLKGVENKREAVTNALKGVGLSIQNSMIGKMMIEAGLRLKNIAQSGVQLALQAARSVATIFSSLAQIPFGIGIPLAIGAAAGMFGLISKAKQVGDLSIKPNGGPVVMSPKEGGIFQGSKRDGLRMGPEEANPTVQVSNQTGDRTNTLLETLIGQNAKKPELSPVNMYEIQ